MLARLTEVDRSALAALVEQVAAQDGPFGEMVFRNQDGSLAMPYARTDPLVHEVVRYFADRSLLLQSFDWMEWEAGRNVVQARDAATIGNSSAQDCLQYLTMLVRADRFTEGALMSFFDSGLMLVLLRRLQTVLEAPGMR